MERRTSGWVYFFVAFVVVLLVGVPLLLFRALAPEPLPAPLPTPTFQPTSPPTRSAAAMVVISATVTLPAPTDTPISAPAVTPTPSVTMSTPITPKVSPTATVPGTSEDLCAREQESAAVEMICFAEPVEGEFNVTSARWSLPYIVHVLREPRNGGGTKVKVVVSEDLVQREVKIIGARRGERSYGCRIWYLITHEGASGYVPAPVVLIPKVDLCPKWDELLRLRGTTSK